MKCPILKEKGVDMLMKKLGSSIVNVVNNIKDSYLKS
jgi:hypothetical protein